MGNRKERRHVENRSYGMENRNNMERGAGAMDTEALTRMVAELLKEKLGTVDGCGSCSRSTQSGYPDFDDVREGADGVTAVKVPLVRTAQRDRLDTGNPKDQVSVCDVSGGLEWAVGYDSGTAIFFLTRFSDCFIIQSKYIAEQGERYVERNI